MYTDDDLAVDNLAVATKSIAVAGVLLMLGHTLTEVRLDPRGWATFRFPASSIHDLRRYLRGRQEAESRVWDQKVARVEREGTPAVEGGVK
jgi:hypothetical protein